MSKLPAFIAKGPSSAGKHPPGFRPWRWIAGGLLLAPIVLVLMANSIFLEKRLSLAPPIQFAGLNLLICFMRYGPVLTVAVMASMMFVWKGGIGSGPSASCAAGCSSRDLFRMEVAPLRRLVVRFSLAAYSPVLLVLLTGLLMQGDERTRLELFVGVVMILGMVGYCVFVVPPLAWSCMLLLPVWRKSHRIPAAGLLALLQSVGLWALVWIAITRWSIWEIPALLVLLLATLVGGLSGALSYFVSAHFRQLLQ